uniref:EB domain-containing protein n=1 Tax=Meloidogyne hapla TaxID=6305 RepID=A0A1I8BHC2_MELHA
MFTTTKELKTTTIATPTQQQKVPFLKGLFRTTQRVPSHRSRAELGKSQTMRRTTLKNCRSDSECSLDGQICDLGRCECGPGYEHHQKSGICQKSNAIRHAKQRGVAFLHTSPIPPTLLTFIPSSSLISGRSHHSVPQQRQFKYQSFAFTNRIRRSTIYITNYKKLRNKRTAR